MSKTIAGLMGPTLLAMGIAMLLNLGSFAVMVEQVSHDIALIFLSGKAPNYFLVACKPLLPRSGKALAIADGEGRNGVWLAEQGLDVVSVDFSPAAQRKAKALARERGVRITFEQADAHTWTYPK